ncbi:MAG: M23 family metallopeptidase [Propionibacteriaceae bacterium]|nr:M23 family metallopeptidase [Propionibacteriaceae bacterium]
MTALNFQQGGSLISVAAVLNFDSGATDLANRIQWAENAVQSSQSSLDRLETIQRLLIAARGDTAVAEARADDAKRAADEQLAQTEAAEAEAALAEQTLSAALDERRAALAAESQAQSQAEAALAEAQSQLDALRREQAEVADEIARRAEAARQAAAAAAQPPGGGYSGVGSSGLIRPIPTAWISSPYGWRYNPIGGFSELHDGTDFAANCWTPILAVASGRVIKSYFGDGYGYRVFVEHGWVGGQFMTSAYNHMVQPGLPVGSWVNQGDVVGYVGTTGYSTGCHLHFHLYVNGSLVNPMSYLP